MTKKNFFLIAAALITAVLVYFAYQKAQKKTTVEGLDQLFAVKDTASISRIFIASKDGLTFDLQRRPDGYWTINKDVLCNPVNMNLLLETIHNMELKRTLNKAERETVIKQMAAEHEKVEIYSRGELIKTFYVGNASLDSKGTYFLMEGSENPYVIYLRDFEGYLTPRFTVDISGWKDKRLFSCTPNTLQSIEMHFPSDPASDFTLLFKQNKFQIKDATSFDTLKVVDYLLKYKSLYVERYIDKIDSKYADSIQKLTPKAQITITDIHKENSGKLTIFPTDFEMSSPCLWESGNKKTWLSIQNHILYSYLKKRKELLGN